MAGITGKNIIEVWKNQDSLYNVFLLAQMFFGRAKTRLCSGPLGQI